MSCNPIKSLFNKMTCIAIIHLMQVAISQVCFYLDYNLDDSYTGTTIMSILSVLPIYYERHSSK